MAASDEESMFMPLGLEDAGQVRGSVRKRLRL